MEKLTFTVDIDAPAETVWNTMLDVATYRPWTRVFHEGSFFIGDWELGSTIRFIGPDDPTVENDGTDGHTLQRGEATEESPAPEFGTGVSAVGPGAGSPAPGFGNGVAAPQLGDEVSAPEFGNGVAAVQPDNGAGQETGHEVDAMSGMVAVVVERRLHEFVSVEYTGFVENGVDDTTSEGARAIAGARESYTFTERDGVTTVTVDMDSDERWASMFCEMWPVGLAELKRISERSRRTVDAS